MFDVRRGRVTSARDITTVIRVEALLEEDRHDHS